MMLLKTIVNWGLIFWPILYFLFVGGVLDAFLVFRLLRLSRFGKAVLEGLLANLFSFITCFCAWPYVFANGFDFADLSLPPALTLWILTVVSEAFVIRLFNRKKRWWPILGVCALMNLISFALLYFFMLAIN